MGRNSILLNLRDPLDAIARDPEKDMKEISKAICNSLAKAFKQTYRWKDGGWWLFSGEEAKRPMRPDEVEWHVARNHHPFVEGGITPDHPDWWKDPES